MSMKSYKELIVWQKGIDLTVLTYSFVKEFPSDDRFGISNQMTRAAVSIPANIAEGFGRYSPVEFSRFLRIALGSTYELQTHLEIVLRLSYISEEKYQIASDLTIQIEKMINALLAKCKDKK